MYILLQCVWATVEMSATLRVFSIPHPGWFDVSHSISPSGAFTSVFGVCTHASETSLGCCHGNQLTWGRGGGWEGAERDPEATIFQALNSHGVFALQLTNNWKYGSLSPINQWPFLPQKEALTKVRHTQCSAQGRVPQEAGFLHLPVEFGNRFSLKPQSLQLVFFE